VPAHAAEPSGAKLARSDQTPGLQHADKLQRADPRRQLTVGVNLALRNEAQLEGFIARVSDRTSPSYGQYLTPDQFAAGYSPAQSQVQTVIDHLRASGLSVSSVSRNRTIVEATGPISAVEAAFGVTIFDWHDRDQNRDFFGNDSEPTLPPAVTSYVVGIAGLNNHYPVHRLGSAPRVGGGPAGGYTPNELKKAYDLTPLAAAGYTGSGQPLGLFELDGFRQSNITTYDTFYGLGSPAPATVLVSGGPGRLGSGEIEVELDIEVMHAIAPASQITVWEGPNTDPGVNATYNAMVTSNTTKSNSTSWGICEPQTTQAEMTTLDNIFKQAAAQGQSFFAASGDHGAYDCGDSRLTVDSPASDPYITGTGGTALSLNSDGSYQSESAWSDQGRFPALGSGGGLSSYWARPSWQTGPGVANSYSNGKRQVPDVALNSDPRTGYSVYVTSGGTGWTVVGGTSAAAPAWAAFTSVYNQYAAANGKPVLGFANPTLYDLGSNAQVYPPVHDITTGDNLYYPTTVGWDYPTGWGSYDAYSFARDLAEPSSWNVSYNVANTPTNWSTGQTQTYNVTMTNTGTQSWPAGDPTPVHLGVHFATIGGGAAHNWPWLTDQRFALSNDLASGASVTLSVAVTAPSNSGSFVLEYQMVKESQFWFSQVADINVTVTVAVTAWSASYSVASTPTSWNTNQTQTYTVSVTNTGNQTWPAGGSNPVRLGIHFTNGSGTWYSDQRYNLSGDLAPGASASLSIAVTAPSNSGSLVLEYQMVKESQFWFSQVADVNVTVAMAVIAWSASYSVATTPTNWSTGQTLTYTVSITNTGNQTWPAGGSNPVRLGIHFTNGSGTWYSDQRFNLSSDLAPGASASMSVAVTAPNNSGSLVLEYRVVKESQFWFSQVADVSVAVTVAVTAWSASYSVASTPTGWTTNQTQTYTVSITNTGNQTWPAGGSNPVRLGIHFTNGSGTWYSDQRFNLSSDLVPAASASMSVAVTAPNNSGSLVLEYQMVKESQFWFSQVADASVTVH
jgi:kumamolisin